MGDGLEREDKSHVCPANSGVIWSQRLQDKKAGAVNMEKRAWIFESARMYNNNSSWNAVLLVCKYEVVGAENMQQNKKIHRYIKLWKDLTYDSYMKRSLVTNLRHILLWMYSYWRLSWQISKVRRKGYIAIICPPYQNHPSKQHNLRKFSPECCLQFSANYQRENRSAI